MRILMLSWEYPPKNVGGLSTHVYYISRSLSKLGHEVHVVTCQDGTAAIKENDNGVFIHRINPYNIATEDFIKWVMHLNFAMIEESIRLIREIGNFDIIHGHDWLSAYALKCIKDSFHIPTICTMHATEYGRNNGIKTDMQRYIDSCEAMLVHECNKVLACSYYMRDEINRLFSISLDKIQVIPNGIERNELQGEIDYKKIRRKYAKDDEKIVFFIGRHVHEKGIQVLIESIPSIVEDYQRVKFIIGGAGPMTVELKERVKKIKLEEKVQFTGYIEEGDKIKLYKIADVAVFPSQYEPFGIVVLEAMVAGCPVVAADVGGITEIITHRVTGMKFIKDSTNSLKENLINVLTDEELTSSLKINAKLDVQEKYSWDKVATLTVDVYNKMLEI